MKFGIMFANVGPFGTPGGLAALAHLAEKAGIESLWTVEHVAVPVGYQSRYPYSPSGKMPGLAMLRSHGGRYRAVQDGDVKIDVAIIAAPSSDAFGNMTGAFGPSACGSLGIHIEWG